MTDRKQSDNRGRLLKGLPASPGIAIGPACLYIKEPLKVEERTLELSEIESEIERLKRAMEKSAKKLSEFLSYGLQKIGEAKAKILEAQIMILEDKILLDSITRRIRAEKKNAEFIVNDELGKYAKLMLSARHEYMHERAYDIEDLTHRIIRNLQQKKLISKVEGEVIMVTNLLTAADAMILSRNHVLGYATDRGGVTSHAALIARALKIPAVLGLGDISREVETGDLLILDGYSGVIVIDPTESQLHEYEQKRERMLQFEARLTELRDLPARTLDGHDVELSANIELPDELDYVMCQGSQGVGLYRTESLLLDRDDFPTEEEQYIEYKKVADRLYPQRVIMRTFDIGGDKIAPEAADEPNPFLGWRGIRVGLDRPALLLTQLRAMLRASTRINLSIMFPMVSTIAEVRQAKKYLEEVKAELRAKRISFDEKVKVGVMIEVPSAALIAGQLAAEVDFLSIGSNDLIQYLLAIDRGNNLVADLYNEFDPSVLITLKHVINAGHKNGKWVGICGQMAGNPFATPLLLGLGIDELSVIPAILPEIKKIIRCLRYKEMQEVATKALSLTTAEEVTIYLQNFLRKSLPDIPLDSDNS